MSENSIPNPESGASSQEAGKQSAHSSSQGCHWDSFHQAFKEGAAHAKAAAEDAAPKVKAALAEATYAIGYGVAYATVFSYTLAKGFVPEPVKAGGRDGAEAGRKAAESFAGQGKAERSQPNPETTDPSTPSGPLALPGPA